MENTTGSITPFLVNKLPKEKYSDVNEFAKDLANALRIDQEKIVVTLIPSADIKGEKGDTGKRGLTGEQGTQGQVGPTGPTGPQAQGLEWEGAWVLAATYVVGSLVSHGGSIHICLVDHVSAADSEPGIGVDTATYWDVFLVLPMVLAGTTTNDDAAAGDVGEYVESVIVFGSAVSLTDSVSADLTSLALTAGDWDVEGNVIFFSASGTVTQSEAGISIVSATQPGSALRAYSGVQHVVASYSDSILPPKTRISIAAPTTVFLVATCTFSAGTIQIFGSMSARRVR
jgi:hypothetical protein